MADPYFSIIIPVYNGGKCLERTLDCVNRQTFTDYEVVICNDGSTDNSVEIINDYIRAHPDIKIIYCFQENKGLGGARNTAIKKARGKVLALLDQDDLWYPHKLARVFNAFKNDPEVDYVGNNEIVRKNDEVVKTSFYGPIKKDFFRQLLLEGNCLSTSATCFKKEVIDRVGYFSEDRQRIHFVEDYDLWLRLASAGCRFFILNEVLGEYVLHEDNYSTNSLGLMTDHELNVLLDNWHNYKNRKPLDFLRIRHRLAALCLRGAYNFLINGNIFRALPYLLKSIIINPLSGLYLIFSAVKKRLINSLEIKKTLKRLLAIFTLGSGFFKRKSRGKIIVLMYHKVIEDTAQSLNIYCSVSASSFEAQVRYLVSNGFKFLTPKEVLSKLNNKEPPTDKCVLLTFDDGSIDNYKYAFPILRKYNVPATFFLPTGYVGTDRTYWWDELELLLSQSSGGKIQLDLNSKKIEIDLASHKRKITAYDSISKSNEFVNSSEDDIRKSLDQLRSILGMGRHENGCSAMNWNEVKIMQQAGMNYGAHTINHVNLKKVDTKTANYEIKNSKDSLEANLNSEIDIFAYPYGEFDPIHVEMLKDAGFSAAFTVESGCISDGDDPYRLKRVLVSGGDDLLIFKARLTEAFPIILKNLKKIIKRGKKIARR